MSVARSAGAAAAAAAAASAAPTVVLPSGLALRCVSRRDVPFIYREIYDRHCYLQHGMELRRGGVVVDVGANIGLFSLWAAEQLGPEGLVVACEPLPATYACLQHNVAEHARWWQGQQQGGPAQQGQQQQQQQQPAGGVDRGGRQGGGSGGSHPCEAPAPILGLQVGVGDGSASEADFTFYPRAAGWSSMRPADGDVMTDMLDFLSNALSSRQAAEAAGVGRVEAVLGSWLAAWAPRWLTLAVWRAVVHLMLGGAQHVRCPMVTMSQLVRQHRLQAVDLLKVDVERAELEVLQGMEDCHWPLVRQAALEVHEGNLEAVLQILCERARFSSIVVEQDAVMRGTSLHTVYCTRL